MTDDITKPIQPESEVVGPSRRDLLELASVEIDGLNQLCLPDGSAADITDGLEAFARAVLARFSRPAPVPLALTDTQLDAMFRAWWAESYPTPPGPHALMTHLGWARHLLEQAGAQQQQPEQPR